MTHVTRSLSLLLSAFVLTFSFPRRPSTARAFWRLVTGRARFHLHLLLLTMQLYLVFPALMAAVDGWPSGLLPSVGLAFQLGSRRCRHHDAWPPVLGIWLGNTGTWLPSHLLSVMAGIAPVPLLRSPHLVDTGPLPAGRSRMGGLGEPRCARRRSAWL